LALNFLIAIVSQSYESVISNQDRAINEGIMDLNWENTLEQNLKADEDIDFVVMIMESQDMEGDQWMGLTRSIKKNFEKIEEKLIREIKESKENRIVDELKNSIEGIKEELFEKIEEEQEKIDERIRENNREMLEFRDVVEQIDLNNLTEIKKIQDEIKSVKFKSHWHNLSEEAKKDFIKMEGEEGEESKR
jgi:hypothetical protein